MVAFARSVAQLPANLSGNPIKWPSALCCQRWQMGTQHTRTRTSEVHRDCAAQLAQGMADERCFVDDGQHTFAGHQAVSAGQVCALDALPLQLRELQGLVAKHAGGREACRRCGVEGEAMGCLQAAVWGSAAGRQLSRALLASDQCWRAMATSCSGGGGEEATRMCRLQRALCCAVLCTQHAPRCAQPAALPAL